MKLILGLAALATATVASSPAGAFISLADAFTTPGFTFGIGTGGSSFTPLTNSYSSCFGSSDFRCVTNGSNNTVPAIGKYSGAGSYSFGTPSVPNNLLFLHPGPDGGQDAILRFTAAGTRTYNLTGAFDRIDASNGSGNGIQASIYTTIGGTTQQIFTGTVTSASYLNNAFFDNLRVSLQAGDTIDFVVNNRNDYQFDSTGLGGALLAVPEPRQWMLMIGGFAFVGGALRARRQRSAQLPSIA